MFRVLLRGHDRLDERSGLRAHLPGPIEHSLRSPLRVVAMAARHVLDLGDVRVRHVAALMAGDPPTALEDLDRGLRRPKLELLPQE